MTLSATSFTRQFRAYIVLAWTIPPVFGLSFLLFIRLFTPAQMLEILTSPLEPAFNIGMLLFALWYFTRFIRPVTDALADPRPDKVATALTRMRRFPLDFWGIFVGYLLLAPASVILSAERYIAFEPRAVDWFRIHLVALIVSIIVGLPIFFRVLDLFGRALNGAPLKGPHLTIRTKVFLIGALVPLLIDTMLVQYYWTRTNYFTTETFFMWLLLELLAIAGSLIFVRSFGQSLGPLQQVIRTGGLAATPDFSTLRAQSTDELGVLADDFRALLEKSTENEANLRSLAENANDGILINLNGKNVFANQRLATILGYRVEELLQTTTHDLVHPDEQDVVSERYRRLLGGEPVSNQYETVFITKSGTSVPVELSSAISVWMGKPAVLVFVRDMTARRHTEDLLARLGRILDESNNEIYVFDADTLHFVQVNEGACRNLGYTAEELKTLTPLDLKPEYTQHVFETLIAPLRRGETRALVFETMHKRKDGSLYPVEVRLQLSQSESPPVFFAIIQDITERRQSEERLQHLAHHDPLTDLPNRVLLENRLNQAMREADRLERLVAVMFLDLDHFKVINDTLGHHTGDALLKAVAERLATCLRPGDTVSRLGGDEFTINLANVAHVDDVTRVAQKIIGQFIAPFRIGGRDLFVTASIGITLYPLDEKDAMSLLKDADIAMYRAKELGRNQYLFYTPELNVRAARRLELETGLRQAIERQEFILHYQPLVNMKTGRIRGMEALLRWQHPEFGLIPPLDFIPLAEDSGLIVPIGEWVLKTACAQLKTWHDTGFPALQVAVNLSSKQLRDKNLIDVVKRALQEAGIEARYLDLELTESALMQDMDLATTILKELKAVGVSISLDDFGTGYSSLSYLKRFPIDELKIDRSFVKDITTDPVGAGLVQAIIAMSNVLNIKVIAEGVETHKQLEFLRRHNCDIAQGYYWSQPVKTESFTDLLQNWSQMKAGKFSIKDR